MPPGSRSGNISIRKNRIADRYQYAIPLVMRTKEKIIMRILLISLFFVGVACASEGEIVFPLGKSASEQYLSEVKHVGFDTLGFDAANASVKNAVENNSAQGTSIIVSGNESIRVYDIDINNDGENEYLAIYTDGGSLRTSGILSVLTKNLKAISVNKIISKNLWNDDSGDLSRHHLWLATPSVVKRDGKYIIRYLDKRPKLLFTEYIWEGEQFKKIGETDSNIY